MKTHDSSSVAVFYDPDFFPEKSFFKLKNNQLNSLLSEYEVVDAKDLKGSNAGFKTLLFPYGGSFPMEAYDNLKGFLEAGGDIIVLGGAPFETPCVQKEGKWQIDDPFYIGFWRECWASEWRNNLGLSFYMTPRESEFCHEPGELQAGKDFSGIIDGNLKNIALQGSLRALHAGRKAVVLEAPEGISPAPEITDFVTIVEALHSEEINGRVLCAGFSTDENWSREDYQKLIGSLILALEKDEISRGCLGMSLDSFLITEGKALEGKIWQRSEGTAKEKIALRITDNKGALILSQKVLSPGAFSLSTESLLKDAFELSLLLNDEVALSVKFAILDADEKPIPAYKVSRSNGQPVIEKDGSPLPAGLYAYDPLDRDLDDLAGQFAAAGVKIQHFLYPLMFGWHGENEYDWSLFDSMAERVLRQDPGILLLPRFLVQSPPWWDEANQDEMKVFSDGHNYIENKETAVAKACASSFVVPWSKMGGGSLRHKVQHVSFYSKKYLDDMKKAFRNFAEHASKSIWKNNFAGIFFGSGTCGEWCNFSASAGLDSNDFSPPALDNFRKWLKDLYPGGQSERSRKWENLSDFGEDDLRLPDTAYLQKTDDYHHYFSEPGKMLKEAKEMPPVEMEKALPPDYARRHISRHGFLKDPAQSWDSIEHARWGGEAFAKLMGRISRDIKDVFPNDIIVGTFAGYLMQEFYLDLDTGEKSYAFQKMLEDEEGIDMVVCPHFYNLRQLIKGDANVKMPTGSLNLSNKIFLDENDQRTCLSERRDYLRYGGTENDGIAESIEALKRNFVARLSKNTGLWWYDLHGQGWYAHPELMKTIEKTQGIYEKLMTPNSASFSGSDNRINVAYSHYSYEYICSCTKFPRLNTAVQIQKHFNRNGFEWEAYFVEDIAKSSKAKAWLFLNAFKIEKEEREWIEANLKKDGNILIWLYAQGLYCDDALSLENSESLTGIKTFWDENSQLSEINLTRQGRNILNSIGDEEAKGFIEDYPGLSADSNVAKISPEVYYDDPESIVLGHASDSGRPAFVAKDFGDWKSVCIAAPIVPNEVMRRLLQWNGMTPTLDTADSFYSNGDIIGISASESGEKTLSYSSEFTVENMWTGEKLKSQSQKLSLHLGRGETFIGRVFK